MKYRTLPVEVTAWQYMGQPHNEWPLFVRGFKAMDQIGQTSEPWRDSVGQLVIPGQKPAGRNDWIVLDGEHLVIIKNGDFQSRFEKV